MIKTRVYNSIQCYTKGSQRLCVGADGFQKLTHINAYGPIHLKGTEYSDFKGKIVKELLTFFSFLIRSQNYICNGEKQALLHLTSIYIYHSIY